MSLTLAGGGADSSFELVRQSLLQGDGLPFADALTAGQIQQAFDAEGVSYGDAGCGTTGTRTSSSSPNAASEGSPSDEDDDGIVDTRGVTLWAMLSQALFTDVQRSCRAAVQRVAVPWERKAARCSGARSPRPTPVPTVARGRRGRKEWLSGWSKAWPCDVKRRFQTNGAGTADGF